MALKYVVHKRTGKVLLVENPELIDLIEDQDVKIERLDELLRGVYDSIGRGEKEMEYALKLVKHYFEANGVVDPDVTEDLPKG